MADTDDRKFVDRTYKQTDPSWDNAFGSPDGRPAHLLRQDALSELDKPQSSAYWAMKQNFKEIDLDGDGFLNPDEIAYAAKKDPDLAALDKDPQSQWTIKRMVNDGRNDSRGISIRDVDAYGAFDVARNHAKNDPGELKLAAEFLDRYFDRISRAKDGFISKDDLGQLITDPSLKFHFRQKFLLVERHFDAISELHRDTVLRSKEHSGLSQQDLKTLIAYDGKIPRR